MKTKKFPWPKGKRAAISLTFDDARLTQPDCGIPIMDAHGVRGTFYVIPAAVEQRLDGWRRAVATGHEIGNHSICHPCSANFSWARKNALEDYTLKRMESELLAANKSIEKLLGVKPTTFAYPCGQRFVGRGENTRSYVPLVAKLFLAGRGYPDEVPSSPAFCDLAQVCGVRADGKSFKTLKPLIDLTIQEGAWLVLAAHEIGEGEGLTMHPDALEEVCRYAQKPANGLWVDTVAAVAGHVARKRKS